MTGRKMILNRFEFLSSVNIVRVISFILLYYTSINHIYITFL